jgi:hypothetical protein
MGVPREIIERLKAAWRIYDRVMRHNATEKLEWEAEETENIFSLLVLGVFVGLPAPPMQLTLELMPLMEDDMHRMLQRVCTANEPLSELFSILEVD